MVGDLDAGWEALRAGRWLSAREIFSAAVESERSPEALEGLSWATWWLDDAEALFGAREQAFRLYRERGDAASAARMATWIASDQIDFHGAVSVASGWLSRASRLLAPLTPGPDHGWLAFHRAYVALIRGDIAAAEEDGARAAQLGADLGVPDLEMLGLAVHGSVLVSRAQVSDGMRYLDEASAMALSGEATIPISRAWTCCFLVSACTRAHDFERAFEWCDRISELADRYGSRYMLGFCKAEYATIQLWRGEWDAAERSLSESIEALSAARAAMAGMSLVQLAELRRRQGRIEECERLLDEVDGSTSAQVCRALLALERDDPRRAIELAERATRSTDRDRRAIDDVPALELLVPAYIAASQLDEAASAADALTEIAETVGTTALRAKATLARAAVAAARGDHERAKLLMEDAIDGLDRCRARFDGSRARIELASTLLALGRPSDALREARDAHDRLSALGAVADCRRAQRVLRACESDAHVDAPPVLVSPREKDVLGLLAVGLTNREIGKRLFISEHTVHRHVTNILRKLDLPSRAAAAAYAVQSGLVASGD